MCGLITQLLYLLYLTTQMKYSLHAWYLCWLAVQHRCAFQARTTGVIYKYLTLNSSNLRPVSRLGSSLTPASLLGRFSLFQWFLSPDIFWSSHKSTFCQGCVLLQGIRCPCPQSAPQRLRWPGEWIETCFVFKYFHHLTGWDNISPTEDKVPEWNNDQGEEDQEEEVLLLLLPWRPALSCLEKPDQIYHMWGYTDNRPSYKGVIWLTFCVAKQPKRK